MCLMAVSVLRSIKRIGQGGKMAPWRAMTPNEVALAEQCEALPASRFVSFRDVQPPPREDVGIIMANGKRRICAFAGAYWGERFEGSVAMGWALLGE